MNTLSAGPIPMHATHRGMVAGPASRCWGTRQAAGISQPLPSPQQQQQQAPQPSTAAVAAAPGHRCHRRQRGPHPARVTNERREIRDPAVLKGTELDPDNADWIEVDPDNPIPDPQLGDLERRIGLPYEEALFTDDVDPEAQAYWFTEPESGWNSEKRRLRKLQALTDADAEAEDDFRHLGADAAGRRMVADIREGETLTGTVVASHFYHGAQVDIGADWDGLLPCQEEHWEELGARLSPGTQLSVRVHRVRDPTLFRFPVQLAAVESSLAEMLPRPEEHRPPMDLRIMNMRPEEIAARSEGLRTWSVERVNIETDADFEYRTGGDASEPASTPITLTRQQQAAMDAAIDQLAGMNW